MKKSVKFRKSLSVCGGLLLLGGVAAIPAQAQTGYAVAGTQLYRFDVSNPAAATLVGNFGVGFTPEGIDFNPANGLLYAINLNSSGTASLFTVNLTTGGTSFVGQFPSFGSGTGTSAANTYDLRGQQLGFDFNPKTLQGDGSIRIRVTAQNGSDIRLNSSNGAVAAVDGTLSADGTTTSVVGSAYSNNVAQMGGATVLYDVSDTTDTLFIQNPPNDGTLVPVGPLGIDAQAVTGFDIFSGAGNTGYLATNADNTGGSEFFTVDLTTGTATPAGNFGALAVNNIAIQPGGADASVPVVRSITRAAGSTNPTGANSVNFTVTFSEAVTGVDVTDFIITPMGNLTGGTATVTGSGAVYTVTVSGFSGNGTLRLDLNDDDTIVDASTTPVPLGGAGVDNGDFTTGDTFTIVPVVRSITRAAGSTNPTSANTVNFTVTFSEAVTGVDPTDFFITRTGDVTGGTVTVSGNGAVYTATVSGLSGNGTLRLSLNDDDSIVTVSTPPVPLGGVGTTGSVAQGNGDFNTGETFAVNMSAPAGAIISEFRLRGATGPGDEYVELFNITGAPLDVSGWSVTNSASTLRLTVPNNTLIPARGHFLFTGGILFGSRYSLTDYATNDRTYSGDIPDTASLTLLNGLGTTVDTASASSPTQNGQFALVRPSMTANSEFILVSTTGDSFGSSLSAIQGAPGPQNLASPIVRNDLLNVLLFDNSVGVNARPNQVRVAGAVSTSAPQGTLLFRRQLSNTGSQPITRLRLRLTSVTTFGARSGGQSDLRLISSIDEMRASASQGGTVAVSGLTLEAPSTEGVAGGASATGGGGVNSSIVDVDVNITPLQPGETRNFNILFGVVTPGSFNLNLDIEALVAPAVQ